MIYVPKLNIPYSEVKIVRKKGRLFIWDKVRRKYVSLTAEEWVRQQFIGYLTNYLDYPITHLSVEKQLENYKQQRADIVVYNKKLRPVLIVECKAPNIQIDKEVFDQIFAYATSEKFMYLVITNGMKNVACKIEHNNCVFVKKIPNFTTL